MSESAASLPHGEIFDLSEHIAAALDIAERIDREHESIDSTTLVAHLRIIAEDYTDAAS